MEFLCHESEPSNDGRSGQGSRVRVTVDDRVVSGLVMGREVCRIVLGAFGSGSQSCDWSGLVMKVECNVLQGSMAASDFDFQKWGGLSMIV